MRFTYSLALLLPAFFCASAAIEDAVVVNMTDGSKKYIRLADDPRMSVGDTVLSIVSSASEIELRRNDVRGWTFGEYDFEAGVASTEVTGPSAFTSGRSIALGGLAPGSEARLFDTEGRLVGISKASSDGSAVIHAPAPGTYIVAADGITFKTIIRK